MRRIFVSALVLGALSLPTWADPLAITPDVINAAVPQDQPGQMIAQIAPPAPVYAAAAQPNLGGGFIQFLFGGSQQNPPAYRPAPAPVSAPPVSQIVSSPAAAESAPPHHAVALASDPDGSADLDESGHPPVDPRYDRQVVDYDGKELPGTIVIDTPHKFLYLVEDGGKAIRYGIGVGRPGFTWAGVKTITAKHEWPDWRPPQAMLERQPELPRFMAGGPQNPLGARAMYLGSTEYRIHGSNEPWTIGHNVSSGCIRLRNADVIDLYNRVKVGTKVVVM
jgi:lipoprotein-anchoring transpeptidase ErfK/SrfK